MRSRHIIDFRCGNRLCKLYLKLFGKKVIVSDPKNNQISTSYNYGKCCFIVNIREYIHPQWKIENYFKKKG